MEYDNVFWEYLEKLIKESGIVIDRPEGTRHTKYHDMVYIVDYGYINDTKSMDNSGIDIFVGSDKNKEIDAIICVIDLLKKDSEIKILFECIEEEKNKFTFFE